MAQEYMTGDEFVTRLLRGERDFSRIRLEAFDLRGHDRFPEVQDYLTKQQLIDSPLLMDNSSFKYLKAEGICLPFVRGTRMDLGAANLRRANLWRADLRDANLGGADLQGAYLWGANFQGADLRQANFARADLRAANLARAKLRDVSFKGADLRGAYLGETSFEGADLRGADLRQVRNLEDAIGLAIASLGEARVTAAEKEIISKKSYVDDTF